MQLIDLGNVQPGVLSKEKPVLMLVVGDSIAAANSAAQAILSQTSPEKERQVIHPAAYHYKDDKGFERDLTPQDWLVTPSGALDQKFKPEKWVVIHPHAYSGDHGSEQGLEEIKATIVSAQKSGQGVVLTAALSEDYDDLAAIIRHFPESEIHVQLVSTSPLARGVDQCFEYCEQVDKLNVAIINAVRAIDSGSLFITGDVRQNLALQEDRLKGMQNNPEHAAPIITTAKQVVDDELSRILASSADLLGERVALEGVRKALEVVEGAIPRFNPMLEDSAKQERAVSSFTDLVVTHSQVKAQGDVGGIRYVAISTPQGETLREFDLRDNAHIIMDGQLLAQSWVEEKRREPQPQELAHTYVKATMILHRDQEGVPPEVREALRGQWQEVTQQFGNNPAGRAALGGWYGGHEGAQQASAALTKVLAERALAPISTKFSDPPANNEITKTGKQVIAESSHYVAVQVGGGNCTLLARDALEEQQLCAKNGRLAPSSPQQSLQQGGSNEPKRGGMDWN